MTYAHCAMAGSFPEHSQEKIADALLKVITEHPLVGEGIYVVVLASNVPIAKAIAWSAVDAGFQAGYKFECRSGHREADEVGEGIYGY